MAGLKPLFSRGGTTGTLLPPNPIVIIRDQVMGDFGLHDKLCVVKTGNTNDFLRCIDKKIECYVQWSERSIPRKAFSSPQTHSNPRHLSRTNP
ncbi:hypothetical protein NAC44_10665 [Allorhizobium sp. BGMRC 0089]|nr:hypothetical protein [Allorhizobium sonneratiae]